MTEQDRSAQPLQTYEEAYRWITGLAAHGIRPGLARMNMLLERLRNPHRRLKFIHVAGTNGKGSVCAFLTSVLRQCGYDVGTFTSPYITKFTNRFQYNLEDIAEEDLLRLANELKPHVEEVAASELGSPTMFEVSTALAILYYAKVVYPDYVVWETGLGGRLDVTNVVAPVISIITNIGHDHMDILGNSLAEIAYEKAGIIKHGVPVVSAVSQPEALEVIRKAAAERNSSLYVLGEDFSEEPVPAGEGEQAFRFKNVFRAIGPLSITLAGAHQRQNAAVAVMALEVLRQYNALVVEDDQLAEGMRLAAWPGRLELVSQSPRVLIDGAHNPEGAQSLAAALDEAYSFKKLHLMAGMLANKNHRDTFRHILPIVDTLIITEPDFHKRLEAEKLYAIVRELQPDGGPEIIVEPDWRRGLERLLALAGPEDMAVVTGTLYLIADVRANLLGEKESEKGW